MRPGAPDGPGAARRARWHARDMRARLALVVLALLTVTACGSGGASATTAGSSAALRLVRVGAFDQPLFVTAPPADRDRVMVVEQPGVIRVVHRGRVLDRPFLDIRSRVTAGGEQGLLGLAFAPDYAQSGRFYVYFTDRASRQVVVAYRRASADVADAASGRVVLRMADPEPNHNGGNMAFGPDGFLYIGTGDGGGGDDQHGARGNAQRLSSLLGKILRIDPRGGSGEPAYRIPPGNPFVGRKGARPEIYAYGLRNPWRFSFDRATGDLAIGDVGQGAVEEIDFARRGRANGVNYGWRPWEGRRRNFREPAPGAVFPVLTKRHADGWCSITGGYVVRDPELPRLAGRYVYGDFCKGEVRAATLRAGGARNDRALGLPTVPNLSSFGEDARGRVYVVNLAGPVYRIAAG